MICICKWVFLKRLKRNRITNVKYTLNRRKRNFSFSCDVLIPQLNHWIQLEFIFCCYAEASNSIDRVEKSSPIAMHDLLSIWQTKAWLIWFHCGFHTSYLWPRFSTRFNLIICGKLDLFVRFVWGITCVYLWACNCIRNSHWLKTTSYQS